MSPHLDAVRVERVWVVGGVVSISACTREVTVACPDCGRDSARVHSRYGRTLADVAVGGRPVLIVLSVRRLFCDNSGCGRRTFAEQVEGLTVRYQRRSPLLQHLAEMAGVLLVGRGDARLLQILQVPLSRTSVLFHLMRFPLAPAATPRVLGVDDFALYANIYGTLLVDAGTRLPIELWAGRDAEQLAAWLRTHPGVEVVCRDDSLVYRQGIIDGAPDAVQLGDRFHLWLGLSKRIGDIARHSPGLPAGRSTRARTGTTTSDPSGTVRPRRHPSPPPREAAVRGGARGDRHRSLAHRRSSRIGLERSDSGAPRVLETAVARPSSLRSADWPVRGHCGVFKKPTRHGQRSARCVITVKGTKIGGLRAQDPGLLQTTAGHRARQVRPCASRTQLGGSGRRPVPSILRAGDRPRLLRAAAAANGAHPQRAALPGVGGQVRRVSSGRRSARSSTPRASRCRAPRSGPAGHAPVAVCGCASVPHGPAAHSPAGLRCVTGPPRPRARRGQRVRGAAGLGWWLAQRRGGHGQR
jgi:transposase IS204/IS1001/IS1096/IS1165 family protein/transposase